MPNLLGNVLILIGSIFALISCIGLYRFESLYLKMHAATKAGTLSTGLVLLGVGIQMNNLHSFTEIILLILFIGITSPISAHMIAKVAQKQ